MIEEKEKQSERRMQKEEGKRKSSRNEGESAEGKIKK